MSGKSKSGETPTKTEKKKLVKDSFRKLKHIAYCRVHTPPLPDEEISFDDFVAYAKHHLCREYNKLWQDPVWDQYVAEDILVEYFSLLFEKNEDFKNEFEATLGDVGYQEAADWFDDAIRKNREEITKLQAAKEAEKEFEFAPVLGE